MKTKMKTKMKMKMKMKIKMKMKTRHQALFGPRADARPVSRHEGVVGPPAVVDLVRARVV